MHVLKAIAGAAAAILLVAAAAAAQAVPPPMTGARVPVRQVENRDAADCDLFLAILTGQVPSCGGRFRPDRDGEAVQACDLAYGRLRIAGGRLIDAEARTEAVVQAHRGALRLKPLIAAVSAHNPAAMEEGRPGTALAAIFPTIIGNAQEEAPETSPHIVEVAILSGMAGRCDAALDRWHVPASHALPEDVAATGVAEFEVNGRSASRTFPDAATAVMARAACEGKAGEVAAAVAAGARIDMAGAGGAMPLAWAIACENLAGIAALLDAGADADAPVGDGWTPVALAAGYREPAILRLLLERGASPDGSGPDGPALSIAYRLAHAGAGRDNLDALLAAGADVDQADEGGRTLVDKAQLYADYESVLQFLRRGYRGNLARVASLLARDNENGRGPEEARGAVGAWLTEQDA